MSKTNVTGVVKDSSGKTTYSAADLVAPLEKTTSLESAIWNHSLYEVTAFPITFAKVAFGMDRGEPYQVF